MRAAAHQFVTVVAASTLIMGVTACDSSSPVAPSEAHLEAPPEADGPFYAGVFLGDAATTPENVRGALSQFNDMSGGRHALVKSFHALDADFGASGWAGRLVREIAAAGATNYMALDLTWSGRSGGSLLTAIDNGSADALLARIAHDIASVPGTVLLEPGWEMNGNWAYAWQGVANGADQSAPAKFVAAWQHIVDVFRREGAHNVQWVFNPNTGNALTGGSPGSTHWNWWGHYYPGDAYVDVLGAHGFNGPRAFGTPYHTFNDLFWGRDSDRIIEDMARLHPDKPILIGEMATEASSDKADWIRAAYQRLYEDGRIIGAIWFNMSKEADWRVDSDAAAVNAYRDAMKGGRVAVRYDAVRDAGSYALGNR